VLTSRDVADFVGLLRPLEKAVVDTPGRCWYRHSLGAVYYRAGRWPEAIRLLYDAGRLHPQQPFVADCLFLAMAQQRRGQTAQARKWLDKAAAQIDRLAKQKASDEPFAWAYSPGPICWSCSTCEVRQRHSFAAAHSNR
jgi:predicted Zn-dependent protease